MFDLTDRAAVITGAAGGIGSATAITFAGQGADVLLAVAPGEGEAGRELAAKVSDVGRRAAVVEADMRSTDAVDGIASRALQEFGRLDIVIANAGIARAIPFGDTDDERWEETVDTNLGGARRCFRAALPTMIEAGWGG